MVKTIHALKVPFLTAISRLTTLKRDHATGCPEEISILQWQKPTLPLGARKERLPPAKTPFTFRRLSKMKA